jgi:hypothetical protein
MTSECAEDIDDIPTRIRVPTTVLRYRSVARTFEPLHAWMALTQPVAVVPTRAVHSGLFRMRSHIRVRHPGPHREAARPIWLSRIAKDFSASAMSAAAEHEQVA